MFQNESTAEHGAAQPNLAQLTSFGTAKIMLVFSESSVDTTCVDRAELHFVEDDCEILL